MRDLGWKHWTNVLGLRADGRDRVRAEKAIARGLTTKDRWDVVCPLYAAGITKLAVLDFWKKQPFDLELAGPWEGNCDGCYLKSWASIMRMIRDHPTRMGWWPTMESVPRGTAGVNRTFRIDREDYATLVDLVRRTPMLPMDETMHDLGEACDSCG